ncbi:MAG: flagellar filament capping protein FliD [Candidatus Binatia bacterium]|nr:flagellar filament capping protein FliD [Candidatus Binatia bacterium]
MATIQFSGLASGLNTSAVINGLLRVERRAIELLQQQKIRFQAQQGVLTTLSSKLASLKSAAQALSLSTDFSKRAASSSDTSVLTAVAGSTAAIGTYSIVVDELAQCKSVQSASFTSATATITTGTLTITVGSSNTTLTIDTTNNTLAGLKEAINSSGAAVTASIVQVAAGDYRLLIQSKHTGTANAFTLSGSLTDPGGSLSDTAEVQAARDAVFFVNTLKITRSSNTISDVIPGITLTLRKASSHPNGTLEPSDPSATLTVSSDTAAIQSAIQKFVDAYNEVVKLINGQLKLDPATQRQGALAGDPVLRGVLHRLRATLSTPSGQETTFAYLSDIGIRFERDGTLTVHSAALTSALESDPLAVSRLFLKSSNGLGKRIPDMVDEFIGGINGALTSRHDGLTASVTSIDKKIAREEERIAALEKRLLEQFTALERLLSQLSAQGQFLSRQLAALNVGRS